MKQQSTNILRFIPFALWLVIVFILLTLPAKDFSKVEISIPNLDKLVHMALFGGCVFWYGFALINKDIKKSYRPTILVALLACVYGVVMEYVQKYCLHPPRDFSYGDMLADASGAIIAFFLIRWITIKCKAYSIRQKAR